VLEGADRLGETVWLPAAVAAEVVMLRELGRTELGLPVLQEEFAALGTIRDPFDRLIVAATRRAGAKLISRDRALAESGLVDVVWS
jgi:predicted nucleic acid-binding protein